MESRAFVAATHPQGQPSAQAWLFAFVLGELLLPAGDPLALQPQVADRLGVQPSGRHYLGTLGLLDCWALALAEVPPGWRRVPLRTAMMALDPAISAVAGRAAQVLEWDRAHRFCGVCGTATELAPLERARRCPRCGQVAYPRISPAIMALVWRPGELLLARSPHFVAGRYSALAGFVEAGESLEECIHREVAEEVGVTVGGVRYFASQSWPFPHSLMVAFTARWEDGSIVAQASEIEDARWFALEALPDVPPSFSIAGQLIAHAVAQLRRGQTP